MPAPASDRSSGHGEVGRPHEHDARPRARPRLGRLEARGEVAIDGPLGTHRVLVHADRDAAEGLLLQHAHLAELDELEQREEGADQVAAVGLRPDEVLERQRAARGDEALEDHADEVRDRQALARHRDDGVVARLLQEAPEGGDERVEVDLHRLVGGRRPARARAHGEPALLLAGLRPELPRGVLELLVREELAHEVEARVELVVVERRVARQERTALEHEQVARHDEELAGAVDVERRDPLLEVLDELVGDARDGQLVDVDLGLLDEVEQEVERALEGVERDAKVSHRGLPRRSSGGASGTTSCTGSRIAVEPRRCTSGR